jgi:hypothetical protein
MRNIKILFLTVLISFAAAGCAQNSASPSNGPGNNSNTTVNKSDNTAAHNTYVNNTYKFSVEYPFGYAPSERQPSPQDTTFSVDFMPLDKNGKPSELDYGNPALFSIIVWPKTTIKQIIDDFGYKKAKNYNSESVNIGGNNFTIVSYERASLPGAADYTPIRLALIPLGSGSLSIEDGQSDIEKVIRDFNFHFLK